MNTPVFQLLGDPPAHTPDLAHLSGGQHCVQLGLAQRAEVADLRIAVGVHPWLTLGGFGHMVGQLCQGLGGGNANARGNADSLEKTRANLVAALREVAADA